MTRRRSTTPSYTTLVGLGTQHQADRKTAITNLRPGVDRCPFTWLCGGLPMWPTPAAAVRAGAEDWLGRLDLDDFPGRIYGGPQIKRLAHSRCNRSAGATTGNRLRALGIQRTVQRPRPAQRDAQRNRARRRRWLI